MFTVYFRFTASVPADPQRVRLVERLLARAEPPVGVSDWRADALGSVAPELGPLAPASAALLASNPTGPAQGGELGEWVFIATPVHLVAGSRSVHMPEDGMVQLEQSEIDALVLDFNRVFGSDGLTLREGRDRLLLCILAAPLHAATHAPEEVAGRDLWDFMPQGPDAARLRRFMTEVQMWLHDHSLNERRGARAAALISGLWLWGGGGTRLQPPAAHAWSAGGDPAFGLLAPRSSYPGAAGSGVVVLAHGPGAPDWPEAEAQWLAPAAADLGAGHVQRLLLSAGHRRFEITAAGARRIWRRSRPWWEYLRESPEPPAQSS